MDLLQQSGYTTSDEEKEKISTKSIITAVSHIVPESRRSVKKARFTRSVPHTTGHWAGHVFASIDDIPSRAYLLKRARKLIQQHQQQHSTQLCKEETTSSNNNITITNTSTTTTINEEMILFHSDLHISLSKPFYITLPCIEGFVSSLRKRLSPVERAIPLHINTSKLNVLLNDDKSRLFFTFPIVDASATVSRLLRLIRGVDHVMTQFHQPIYYDNPIFHVSVASVAVSGNYNYLCNQESATININTVLHDLSPASHDIDDEINNNGISSCDEETSPCSSESESESHSVSILISKINCSFGGSAKRYSISLHTN